MLGSTLFTQRVGAVAISKTTYEPQMRMATHTHDLAYVSFVVEGHYTERSADAPRHLRRSMLVYHPAGEVHADYVHDQSMTTINLEYSDGDLPSAFFCAQGPEVAELEHGFLSALPGSGASLLRSIAAIRAYLRRRVARSQPPEPMIVARATLQNLERERPVSALATELGMHRVRLHRAFKRAYGESPRANATKQRIATAAKLLTASSDRVADIAAACGFYDQSHFCRQFRLATGMTPSHYRRVFAG
ncbi:MAG: AraC family transcriptional regulator [Candidatus Cybelea sp.]